MNPTLEALKAAQLYLGRDWLPTDRLQETRELVEAALQAEQGQEPKEVEAWCGYIASIIEAYLLITAPDDLASRETAIQGIIQRRLHHLKALQPTPPAEQWVSVKERLHNDIIWMTHGRWIVDEALQISYSAGFNDARIRAARIVVDSTDAGDKHE